MGFDLRGLNPNLTRQEPPLPSMADREWQEENCGKYFRNNVWWWRQLWNFVCNSCDNIITDKDASSGSFNDGHRISKTKAERIARKLYRLIKNGQVKEYEEEYRKYLTSLDQVDCETCDATGKRQEPPKTGAGDVKCNGCNGTGKKDNWAKSYPFDEDNVRRFANFCANSGGFEIW